MTLGEKIRHLRSLEGARRGHDRELTQTEVSKLMKEELGETVTQAYLSQIERGTRRHLTGDTRELLARFFRVHPGYLVDDPVGYEVEIPTDPHGAERTIDAWLNEGADRFKNDPELSQALLVLSRRKDTRNCLILIGQLLETAGPTVPASGETKRKPRSRRGK